MMRLDGASTASRSSRPPSSTTSGAAASKDHFALAGYALLPGWSYRNMWWVSHNDARRVHRARHSRPGDLHRSGRRDGHRPLRLASPGRQRQPRSDVAAGVSRGRRAPDANVDHPQITRMTQIHVIARRAAAHADLGPRPKAAVAVGAAREAKSATCDCPQRSSLPPRSNRRRAGLRPARPRSFGLRNQRNLRM